MLFSKDAKNFVEIGESKFFPAFRTAAIELGVKSGEPIYCKEDAEAYMVTVTFRG